MALSEDEDFIAAVLDKFIEAADWPVERRVDLCIRVSLLVRRLETGSIARDKRSGAIKARAPMPVARDAAVEPKAATK